jgi:penicillin-binding protein 2
MYIISLFNKKLYSAAFFIIFAFIVILFRLAHLQIILKNKLYNQSQRNFLRVETVPSLRGNILDCNDILLATNRPTTNLYWQGTGKSILNKDHLQLLQKIESIIQKPLLNVEQLLADLQYAERRHQKFLLAADIPFEQLSQIVEQLPYQKNLSINTHFKRFYPHQASACHLLGYLTRMDMETYGKMGLEKIFEDILKGESGEKQKMINSIGINLAEVEIKKALAGADIKTTLDIGLQGIIEKVFPEDFSGTFLVMDPEDGALLALLSRPLFDPAIFLDPLNHQEWLSLQEKQPFLNRAFSACYPPGSIFKLVTMSAVLEHNIIDVNSSWYCGGFVEFAKRQYWCANHNGHGWLTAEQSLAHSCNVMFFEIGKRINIDLLADYASRFGFGKKTNIIFAEKEGLVPTAAWKKRVKGEKWWPGDTLSAVIGQSYLLVTPIQVAVMISSIFTGSLVTPRVLSNEPIQKEPLQIKLDTRKFLQQSMQSVVTRGTGQQVRKVKDIKIYAKTSTAQVSSMEKRDFGKSYLEHGWFVGYFSYQDRKPLTIVILVENSGTSRIATDVAKNFLMEYKKLVDK